MDSSISVDRAGGPLRFAALGDSLTVGLGDQMPDGGWRGWAGLLTDAIDGDVELHNLAAPGALATDVAGRQLPAALPLRPHLASVITGVNDTLRDTFDPRAIGAALHRTVGGLHARGATVVTVRLPDPGQMLRLPGALARPLARRMRAVNAVMDAVAARFGTCHVNFADHPAVLDRRTWSIDRLHPSERGHRVLAGCVADALATRGVPVRRRPGVEPTNPVPTRRAQARWMATKGTGWLLRRSRDLLPVLAAMVVAEWWHGMEGMAARVDDRLAREVADALAHLDNPLPSRNTAPAGGRFP